MNLLEGVWWFEASLKDSFTWHVLTNHCELGVRGVGGVGNSRQGGHQRPRASKGAGICVECDREGPPGRMGVV